MEVQSKPKRVMSESHKEAISAAKKGKPKSEAHKQKIRDYWANVRCALAAQNMH